MSSTPRRAGRGLAIVEILIVLVIVALLFAIAIPQFSRVAVRPVVQPDSVVVTNASGPLSVRVVGWRGRAVPGVTVRFEATGRGGAVTPTSAVTDSGGLASTTWIVRDTSRSVVFSASIEGQKSRVTVPVRVSAGSVTPAPPPGAR
jgi:Tfp pilus assembly protein FimT